jgi:hypothetical protein
MPVHNGQPGAPLATTQTMTTVELDEGEKAALVELLKRTIAADPFPMSPRVRQLRAILEKLEPQPYPAPKPAPKPAAHTAGSTTPARCVGGLSNIGCRIRHLKF